MYTSLTIFRLAGAAADHAGLSQSQTARNIAHADTPGYRAQRYESFQQSLGYGGIGLLQTREAHLPTNPQNSAYRLIETGDQAAPNGNNVALETEMFQAVSSARDHSRALALYHHGIRLLRTSLGR